MSDEDRRLLEAILVNLAANASNYNQYLDDLLVEFVKSGERSRGEENE